MKPTKKNKKEVTGGAKQKYLALGQLVTYNLSLLSEDEIISDRNFTKVDDKKAGITVGKIVEDEKGFGKTETLTLFFCSVTPAQAAITITCKAESEQPFAPE